MNKRILVLSLNDGTDMRLQKTLRSLSVSFDVDYFGFGSYSCLEKINYIESEENYKKTSSLLRYIFKVRRLIKCNSYHRVWIVDEELLFLVSILVFVNRSFVCDIYDSFFLKRNLNGIVGKMLQSLLHRNLGYVIVTDEFRKELLPKKSAKKATIISNYPNAIDPISFQLEELDIAFIGTLSRSRGGELIRKCLESKECPNILMAGWIKDDYTKDLIKDKRVTYIGICSQKEMNSTLMGKKYCLFCCYPPINKNNIYASPNKVWDAVLTNNFVAINSEVLISKTISSKGLGVTYSYRDFDSEKLLKEIKEFSTVVIKDRDRYTWECQESKLLSLC